MRRTRQLAILLTLCFAVAVSGCGDSDSTSGADIAAGADIATGVDSTGGADGTGSDDAQTDTGEQPFAGYAHVAPPSGTVSMTLRAQRWVDHLEDDVLPFWTMSEALGDPVGNYPTYRGMDGSVQQPTERRPRMIARQIYTYCAAYLMTGDESLLEYAGAGVDWLLTHARDTERGGWHARIASDGSPLGDDHKTAQDAAYCALGAGAWYFVTRDPEAEQAVLETRDLLMSPDGFWDAANGRIRDAMTADMQSPVDLENDGGAELVAQLDAINAFMLLVQPVLSDAARRDQFLDDLETLGNVLVDDFYEDGIFWGVDSNKGRYGTKHVDFGHTLKSWWMLLQIDKRLADHPFAELIAANAHTQLERAYDADNGRWAKRPTSASAVEYGSDWWIYAEADQFAATLNLLDYRYTDELRETAGNWISDYVDRGRAAREVISGINRDGGWVWNWTDNDTAKCNHWKNGFHSAEHALVFYILGANLEGDDAVLHFAPMAAPDTFAARPYSFEGAETSRQSTGTVTIDGATHHEVQVSFGELY